MKSREGPAGTVQPHPALFVAKRGRQLRDSDLATSTPGDTPCADPGLDRLEANVDPPRARRVENLGGAGEVDAVPAMRDG